MERNLSNARVLELYQLFILGLNRIVSDLEPSRISSILRSLDVLEATGIEVALLDSLRNFMNQSKAKLDEVVERTHLELILRELEKKEIEALILEELKPDKNSEEFARCLFTHKEFAINPSSINNKQEILEKELQNLQGDNLKLHQEKIEIFDEIMQLRLDLITKINL